MNQFLQWSSIGEVPADLGPTVVSIGKFDGIHLGHQALMKVAVDQAKELGATSAVITFDRHPLALLNPAALKLPLIGARQKAKLIQAAGIDALLTLPFDEALSQLTATEFVENILVKTMNAKVVVVGVDFRFGKGGAGTPELLAELSQIHGFTLHIVPPVLVDGERVSSSLVRELLDTGNVARAASLLGRRHETTGLVEHGLKLGRQLGFPTANMSRNSEGYLPLDGVYAGWLYSDGVRYPAALSIGINDTIQAVPRLMEAHVLNRKDLDLYDKEVTVEYVSFVRPSVKFSGIETLITAIQADCDKIQGILDLDK
jgi:riboflavin kinase / FMN adenylyltransferase